MADGKSSLVIIQLCMLGPTRQTRSKRHLTSTLQSGIFGTHRVFIQLLSTIDLTSVKKLSFKFTVVLRGTSKVCYNLRNLNSLWKLKLIFGKSLRKIHIFSAILIEIIT